MSKTEQIFKTVDFSVETDLKERLRKQLFENREISLSEKGRRDSSEPGGSNIIGNVVSNAGSSARSRGDRGRFFVSKDILYIVLIAVYEMV